jgi:hypothetical protein
VQLVRVGAAHVPPQSVPSVVHAARDPVGVPACCEHVPTSPVSAHDSHCPVHAALQQTPSATKPDVHWSALVALDPFGNLAEHAPAVVQ